MQMTSPHEARVSAGGHDSDQDQPGGDKAATLEGGSSWYWTNMLNFSQSGSSSTYTSAGQVAGSQIKAGSPPSSSSVQNNNINLNPNSYYNCSNNQLNQGSLLPSCSNNTAGNNDPESAVWGQDFLTGPICDGKATIPGCSPDDGLQELLYPRSVRELLLDAQSPSWDLLHQAAVDKSFGFPVGPDDQLGSAQLHGLPPTNTDVHPPRAVRAGLHFSHDDRLSCSTASSTLSDSALAGAETHWPVTEAAVTDHAAQGAGRACLMHVPQTTFFQHQFDHTRVKEQYAPHLSASCCATSSSALAKAGAANPFLLQHHHPQHSLCLMNPAQLTAGMQLKEAAMANLNADVKTGKHKLHSWPGSPTAAATCMHLDLTGGQVHCAGGAAPAIDDDRLLLNSLKAKHHHHIQNAAFATAASPSLVNQEVSFFQIADHHQLLQQAGLQAHLHRHAAAGVLNNQPLQYLHQHGGGLKKSRSHLEIGHTNIEPARDLKGSPDDFALKRLKVESQQQQQQTTSSGSFKPARKEKLGERITTLQQLVSPYGKTDTASVLLEAIGYIKFLQDQVQTLSSPYLKSATNSTSQNVDKNQNGEELKPDLRSKGLCLVPLSCTMQVANDNGADYWYGGAFR